MVKMYKAKIRGVGFNEFVEPGVWLTKDELDLVVERQYNEKLCSKVVNLGGKYFKPEDFECVIQEKTLRELLKSDSPLVDSALLESLAKAGYLGEVIENCPPGYRKFVNRLAESGQYKISSGEEEKTNLEGLERLKKLKEGHNENQIF